ncbi:MAG: hypothetical protein BGO70_14450 [Bacteroidetes bacterium 43-93]|nr:Crp/Fnr family transcriptional regulator [Bacteroidota bacterium]OJW96997.1 MAG: hypothetical protein BGO70_14450 [Bacteroidetes bacterium 43-93]
MSDNTSKFSKIKQFYFNLFPGLQEKNWSNFESKLAVREFRKHEKMLQPGEVCNAICFINKGIIRSYYDIDGKEVITNFYTEEASFCNYESFLSRKPSLFFADALEHTEVVQIDYDALQYIYTYLPDSERVGRLMAEQLYISLSGRVAALLLDSPEQRYQKFLKEKSSFIQRIPQYMIASYLGITPEALSRIRARISKRNNEEAAEEMQKNKAL